MPKGKKGSSTIILCKVCGQLRRHHALGMCDKCYKHSVWLSKKKTFSPRVCKCGCGLSFTPTNGHQKYFNTKHRLKFLRNKTKFLATVYCLKCGKLGSCLGLYYKAKKRPHQESLLALQFIHEKMIKGKTYLRTCYIALK
jgi:hypothetical protein